MHTIYSIYILYTIYILYNISYIYTTHVLYIIYILYIYYIIYNIPMTYNEIRWRPPVYLRGNVPSGAVVSAPDCMWFFPNITPYKAGTVL